MKPSAFLMLFLGLLSGHANAWTVKSVSSFACLSIDGQAIPYGSPLASLCCQDKHLIMNAPAECRIGFNTILDDAGSGAAYSISIAQNTLNVAANMNGSVSDYQAAATPAPSGSNSGGGADLSAITAPGGNGLSPTGGPVAPGAGYSKDGTGPANSAASNEGSSGSGGVKSAASRDDKNAPGYNADGANGKADMAYLGGRKDVAGKGAGGLNFNFGNGAEGKGSGGPDELNLANSEKTDANGKLIDEDGSGVAEDPADYLKRIDQSANIFKVVSARYMKKKSLWKVKTE